ncbi:MAG: hypothetical protein GC154_04190 [bacterium]|nr:hypothetical protein [bacterium]
MIESPNFITFLNENRFQLAHRLVEKIGDQSNTIAAIDDFQPQIQKLAFELVDHLADAVASDNRRVFANFVIWLNLTIQPELKDFIKPILIAMQDEFNQDGTDAEDVNLFALSCIEEGLSEMGIQSCSPQKIRTVNKFDEIRRQYVDHLLAGEKQKAIDGILKQVKGGMSVKDIYLHVLQEALYKIGRLWQENKITVAKEHYCTAVTQLAISQLYPYIFTTNKNGLNLVAVCVGGEVHEIGVRMVADFFEMEGWNTWYLGSNTPAESIIDSVIENKTDLLAISCTISLHIRRVISIIRMLRSNPESKDVCVMVGGQPFNQIPNLWKEIGADLYASNAQDAIEAARSRFHF